ncbi:hypothetical protein NUSPORA_01343 [Nucleospora cyclopteri]
MKLFLLPTHVLAFNLEGKQSANNEKIQFIVIRIKNNQLYCKIMTFILIAIYRRHWSENNKINVKFIKSLIYNE